MLESMLVQMRRNKETEDLTVSKFSMKTNILGRQNSLCKEIITDLINLLKWKVLERKLEK